MDPAPITGWRAETLSFAGTTLDCLYVDVVADRPDVEGFLRDYDHCGDRTAWDWQASRSPARATIGIAIVHGCGNPAALRLEFDLAADRGALDRLAATEALVVAVADRPVAAVAVDAGAVHRAVAAADAGTRRLAVRFN